MAMNKKSGKHLKGVLEKERVGQKKEHKKVGSKGFADFKVKLAAKLRAFAMDTAEIQVDIPLPPDAASQDIAKIFYNLSRQALETTHNELDHIALQKAANLLAYSDHIHAVWRGGITDRRAGFSL